MEPAGPCRGRSSRRRGSAAVCGPAPGRGPRPGGNESRSPDTGRRGERVSAAPSPPPCGRSCPRGGQALRVVAPVRYESPGEAGIEALAVVVVAPARDPELVGRLGERGPQAQEPEELGLALGKAALHLVEGEAGLEIDRFRS